MDSSIHQNSESSQTLISNAPVLDTTQSESVQLPVAPALDTTQSEPAELPDAPALDTAQSESAELPDAPSLDTAQSESAELPDAASLDTAQSESAELPDAPSPDTSQSESAELPDAASPDTSQSESAELPDAASPDTSQSESAELPDAASPDTSQSESAELPDAASPDTSQSESAELPDAASPDTSQSESAELPDAPSPDTSQSESAELPDAASPDTSQSESAELPDAASPDTSQSESAELPDAPSPDTSQSESAELADAASPDTSQSKSAELPEAASPDTSQSESAELPDAASPDTSQSESAELPVAASPDTTQSESAELPDEASLDTAQSESAQLHDALVLDTTQSESVQLDDQCKPISQDSVCKTQNHLSDLQSLEKSELLIESKENSVSLESTMEDDISESSGDQAVNEVLEDLGISKDFNTENHSVCVTIENPEALGFSDESSTELELVKTTENFSESAEESRKKECKSNLIVEDTIKQNSISTADPNCSISGAAQNERKFLSFETSNSSSQSLLEQEKASLTETSEDSTCDNIVEEVCYCHEQHQKNASLTNSEKNVKARLSTKATDFVSEQFLTESSKTTSDDQELTNNTNSFESSNEEPEQLNTSDKLKSSLNPTKMCMGKVQVVEFPDKEEFKNAMPGPEAADDLRSNVLKLATAIVKQTCENSDEGLQKFETREPRNTTSVLLERKASSAPDFIKSLDEDGNDFLSYENLKKSDSISSFESNPFSYYYIRPMISAEFEHYENNECAKTFFSDKEWENLQFLKHSKTLKKDANCGTSSSGEFLENVKETLNSENNLNSTESKANLVAALESECAASSTQNETDEYTNSENKIESAGLGGNFSYCKLESDIESKPVCVKLPNEPSLELSLSKYMTNLNELIEIEKKRIREEQDKILHEDSEVSRVDSTPSALEKLNSCSSSKLDHSNIQQSFSSHSNLPKVIETNLIHEQLEKDDDPFYSEYLNEVFNLQSLDNKINKWTVLKPASEDSLLKRIAERNFQFRKEPTSSKTLERKVLSENSTDNSPCSSKISEKSSEIFKQNVEKNSVSINLSCFPKHSDAFDVNEAANTFSSFIPKAEEERKLNESNFELIKKIIKSPCLPLNEGTLNNCKFELIKETESSKSESVKVKETKKSGRWTMIDFESNHDFPLAEDILDPYVAKKGQVITECDAELKFSVERFTRESLSPDSDLESLSPKLSDKQTTQSKQKTVYDNIAKYVDATCVNSGNWVTKVYNSLGEPYSEPITVSLVKEIIRPKIQETRDTDLETSSDEFQEYPSSKPITLSLVKEVIRPKFQENNDSDFETSSEESTEDSEVTNASVKSSSDFITISSVNKVFQKESVHDAKANIGYPSKVQDYANKVNPMNESNSSNVLDSDSNHQLPVWNKCLSYAMTIPILSFLFPLYFVQLVYFILNAWNISKR